MIDPSDYPADISISGDIKTVTFDFSTINWGYYFYSDTGGSTIKLGDFTFNVPSDSRFYVCQIFPFGQPIVPDYVSSNNFGCLYIGDLSPGSAIDFSFDIHFECLWQNYSGSINHRMRIDRYWLYDLYDSSGTFITTVQGESSSDIWELQPHPSDYDKLVYDGSYQITGTFPANATYVRPRIRIACVNSAEYNILDFGVFQKGFRMSVDINTILENSNLQQEILDKLDQIINGRPGDNAESDRLDSDVNNKVNEFNGLLNGLDSMQKPNISDISMGPGDSFSSSSAMVLTQNLSSFWNLNVTTKMVISLLGLLTLSYIIFGKKK